MKILLRIILILFAQSSFAKTSQLNILSWSSYIEPSIIQQFEQETNIKVNLDYIDNNYSLESKIIATNHGYDITVPTLAPFFMRQVQFGLFQELDFSRLKNYHHIDPKAIGFTKNSNSSDHYAIPFMLDSVGIGYDHDKIIKIMPDAPINSLSMIFNPEIISKFTSCGVEILDSPEDIIALALLYLNLDPNSEKEEDLKKAAEVLHKIRPFLNNINGVLYFNNLASGDNCLVIGYSGDIVQARQMSHKSNRKADIRYILPKEGSVLTLDLMAIPVAAPNKDNAYKFLDFIMQPEINARIANAIGFTSPNMASYPLIKPEFINNPNIYPLQHNTTKFHTLNIPSSTYNRLRNLTWMKFLSDEKD
jgi:putrescine transport system substrate-binding protein